MVLDKPKRRLILFIVSFLIISAIIGFFLLILLKDLQDPEYRQVFSQRIKDTGFLGLFLFFIFHVIKIVIVVIPGGPVQVIAGAAFGAWAGVMVLLAGCAVGTIIIYFIVKKFGQKLINRFFNIDLFGSWGFLQDENKVATITFILFLIPGFPKDNMSYLIPLTKMPLLKFVIISLAARFPAMLASTIMGDVLIEGNVFLFVIIFAVTAVIGIVGIQFRTQIINLFARKKTPDETRTPTFDTLD